MAGRDEGYYGPSASDLGRGCFVVLAAIAALGFAVTLFAFSACSADEPPEAEESVALDVGGTGELVIDTGNAALMHSFGLPTKADVMNFHLHGQWGFYLATERGDVLRVFDELPGDEARWDELYGIDAGNAAFEY